jgi:hypothetical protein
MIHNGKIGRLPRAIQAHLNRRLDNGEKGRTLAAWLNSLPEVQAVMAREFDNKPVREQNLSEWRKHGYKEWLALDLTRQLGRDVGELQPPGSPPLADQMAVWLAARCLMAVQKLAGKSGDGGMELKVLRELLRDVVAVRRGDHSGARLKMEQERLERAREKTAEEVIARFQRWLKNPEVRDLVCQNYVSPEERARRLREIYGLPPKAPEPPEAAVPAGDESNQVRPGQTTFSNGHAPSANRYDI